MTRLCFYRTFFVIVFIGVFRIAGLRAQEDSLSNIPDANTSRLLVAPTAKSLPEDNGYINLAEILLPNFAYGITDEISFRGGFTPFTISGNVLFFALAGLQVASYGNFALSGGVVLTNITGSNRNWENALYGYGVASYGDDKAAIHAGFGGGYSSSRESNSAVFMIGAEYKIARTTKLITENWIVSENSTGAFSLGVRIFGKSLTGEIGAVILTTDNYMKIESIVPWLGITFIL